MSKNVFNGKNLTTKTFKFLINFPGIVINYKRNLKGSTKLFPSRLYLVYACKLTWKMGHSSFPSKLLWPHA